MDTLTRSRERYAGFAREHEIAELKEAVDEVGSSHPLIAFAYSDETEADGDSPLDAAILDGLVHPYRQDAPPTTSGGHSPAARAFWNAPRTQRTRRTPGRGK